MGIDANHFGEICRRAQAGDHAAAEFLFAQCFGQLRAAIRPMMGESLAREGFEPEDIVQEVYAAAWEKMPAAEFPSPAAFVAWLLTIAKNKVLDLQKRAAVRHRVNLRSDYRTTGHRPSYGAVLERVGMTQTMPSQVARRHEALALLSTRMACLPEDYRRVIQLRLVQGLPVVEVARRLERTEAAVHTLLYRSLRRLRDLMGRPSEYFSTHGI